jgi:rhamnosyltransferase
MDKKKIGIAGTRGIPAVYGGFETFAEELSYRLHARGFIVTVYCDKNSYSKNNLNGVNLKYLPLKKSTNQVIYFFLSLIKGLRDNDILIVTSTGASYFYFLNIFFKKIIITNSDGIESLRSKWSFFSRKYLFYSQYFASKWSTIIVTDSKGMENYWTNFYPKSVKVTTIEYGAPLVKNSKDYECVLKEYHLKKNDYYLIVARLEPENNLIMMINGYLKSRTQKKLVIVGGFTSAHYQKDLKHYSSDKVLFLNAVYDSFKLKALRLNCFTYIHGHSVGGTNPSLLEAMGCSNLCICHDNIFNREVTENKQFYFKDSFELTKIINNLETLSTEKINEYRELSFNRIKVYYSWERITDVYVSLFNSFQN